MATNAVMSDPIITIDNDSIEIIPNSLSFDLGLGDISVRALATGSGISSTVHAVNAETKKGSVEFSMANTLAGIEFVKKWVEASKTNGSTIDFEHSSKHINYNNMFLISSPKFTVSMDGTIEIKFEGSPATF